MALIILYCHFQSKSLLYFLYMMWMHLPFMSRTNQ